MGPMRSKRLTPQLGLREEANLFLPLAAVVLIGVSLTTLLLFRSGVEQLAREHREDSLERASAAVTIMAGRQTEPALRRAADGARGAAVIDGDGIGLIQVGELPLQNLLVPASGQPLDEPLAVGPDGKTGGAIVVFAPLDASSTLRLDYPANTLYRQRVLVRRLALIVLAADATLLVIFLLYLRRRLVRPMDQLLESARAIQKNAKGGALGDAGDELRFLLETFEDAVRALNDEAARVEELELETLQRTLSSSLESGLLVLDDEGRLLDVNEAGRAVLGLDDSNVSPGADLRQVFSQTPALEERLRQALTSGEGLTREECVVETDRGQRTLGMTLTALRRDDESIRGWLVLFADLTDVLEENRRERLSESLERIAELSAGLAHELRNGIASLSGYLTLLEQRRNDDDITGTLVEMRSETDQLLRVLEDFLSFARPGSARMTAVDLLRVVHRAAADPVLHEARLRIRSDESKLPTLQGDSLLLERALRNLLHNAHRAHLAGARPDEPIEVSIAVIGSQMSVKISDRGLGVPVELRDRLFVPFATTSANGVGLGLALSHRIAELHGATLELADREGGGTIATLTFAVRSEAAVASATDRNQRDAT